MTEKITLQEPKFPYRGQSWPIKLRLLLLIRGTHRWNGWVRDFTAWLERRG